MTEALTKANTIDHDFVLVPEWDGSPNDIRRVCLKWDGENDIPQFTKEDICHIYNLTDGREVGTVDKLTEEARK